MTIEIRQMVIKSSIGNGAGPSVLQKKDAPKNSAQDEDCEDCGGCEGGLGGSEERQRMRALIAAEFERMRER
ncbi:DUF5908 family protein [Dyella flagellata]|uniref:Uncharacterized protein n=1 Tax=Dyella flagellata TaxID=1867833 RepID=A0ABQ5XAX9_9GAMM|nr:DUF5908 family protein [Dyella flagellata]GLQ87814.1 hypothetical protein GCM10007898_13820 [Dyella flagellata]